MAQSQTEADDALLETIDTRGMSADEELTRKTVEEALSDVRGRLSDNLSAYEGMGNESEKTVNDVLSPENVDHIQVRARPFENPRIIFWLKSCPVWANDAWNDYLYPRGMNAFNAKVNVVIDVREF